MKDLLDSSVNYRQNSKAFTFSLQEGNGCCITTKLTHNPKNSENIYNSYSKSIEYSSTVFIEKKASYNHFADLISYLHHKYYYILSCIECKCKEFLPL